MIDLQAINSVVAQYERFGWNLERILLKTPTHDVSTAFPNLPIITSSQDALWFSRESGSGRAWELRRLTGSPFALVRVIDANASLREREDILSEVDIQMSEKDATPSSVIPPEK